MDTEFSFDGVFAELLNVIIDFYNDLISGGKPDLTGGFGIFVSSATLLKHQGFREEREVRIVACPANDHIIDMVRSDSPDWIPPKPLKTILHRETPIGMIPYVSLFSDISESLPVKRVIVGPSKTQDENYERVNLLLTRIIHEAG